MAPLARLTLPRVDAFIPAYESALAVTDLITATLLFGQFLRLRTRALLLLACGYLFNALIIVPHALTFPGVFSATGLLGAGTQTTAWLYCFWHGGFALFVLAYALLAGRESAAVERRRGAAAIAISAVLVAVVVGVLTLVSIRAHDWLPTIIVGTDYSLLVSKGVSPAICAISIAALAFLWRRRNESVLDLWLIVVLCVWLCDVILSAVVGSARYDLGWYGGRSYGLLAASFLLVALLFELNKLYRSLARALATAEARNLELVQSRQQLVHAQRLEAMGQLTGGVAHDFNNLLTIVIGSLDMILRSRGDTSKVERLARAAIHAGQRGAKLTEQLLTFARRQVNRPETVNPNHLLSDFDGLLRRAAGDGVEIVTRLSPVLDPVHIDPSQFEAAVINLVVNARDAMSGIGRVIIETANVEIGAATEDLGPGRHVVISVSDTGTGMTPDVLAKAFDPFFTTKEVGRGSGLGLSQVYGFAKSIGGHVRIYSEVGVGTTVRLFVPRSATQPRVAKTMVADLPMRPAQGDEAILVVEDDADVLELAIEGLTGLGYEVLSAANAAQALDILRSDKPINLMFSDIIMPGGMNGVQLAVEARRIRPEMKVLLTSGYTAQALKLEHGLPDDLEVLGKPYRSEDLATKLRIVMEE